MIYLDIETFCTQDIKSLGAYKYATLCELMLLCYCVDDGPLITVDLTAGDSLDHFFKVVADGHELCAHNANFERRVLGTLYPEEIGTVPLSRWQCTMVLALTGGLPGKLETLCAALGMSDDKAKIKDGAKLINRFCKPAGKNHKADRYTRETHEGEWSRFIEYCLRDAELVRELWDSLPRRGYIVERKYWLLDQEINDRGLPIDKELAVAAIKMSRKTFDELNVELETITKGEVTEASQVAKMKKFFDKHDLNIDSLSKDVIPKLLARDDLHPKVRRVIEIRSQAGKASIAKYEAALAALMDDGRLRGSLQFCGAGRTRRWAGRLLQPQNMLRPVFDDCEVGALVSVIKDGDVAPFYSDPIEVTMSAIRACIAAFPGHKLVVSDLANIEGRVLAWLASEGWKLEAYQLYDAGDGPDLYYVAFSRSFSIPIEEVTKAQRQIGKTVELACGFQGAVGAFNTMAKTFGVVLSEDEIVKTVKAWRKAHPAIVKYWYGTQDAAINAVEKPGRVYQCGKVQWVYDTRTIPMLIAKLPSGGFLNYHKPQVNLVRDRGRTNAVLSYLGNVYGKWVRIPTYGGKLVENVTQAVARDVLAEGMQLVNRAGYAPILTVHDEVVTECEDTAAYSHKALSSMLAQNPDWCPDLPLAAEGYESQFYRKG